MRALPLLLVAWAVGSARAEAPTNPHGAADACGSCHLPAQGEAAIGAAREVAASCYTCHPEETHHPMEMPPTAEIGPPADWPLEGGKVVCTTCHVEPSHAGLADAPKPYFRGGPYAVPTDFCYSCHDKSRMASASTSPHAAQAPYAEGDPTCGACHVGVPARGAAPEQAQLRLDPAKACDTCHPSAPHLGAAEHMGRAVPDEARAGLPPEMPLAGAAIACWTCHEVHDGQVAGAVGESPFAQGLHASLVAGGWADIPTDAIFPGTPSEHSPMLARPLEKGALCEACHGDGPP